MDVSFSVASGSLGKEVFLPINPPSDIASMGSFMTNEMSRFDRRLIDIASKVVARWGLDFPSSPKNPKRAVAIALKQAIAVAAAKPFVPVYPDDHSWNSIGLRGLTVARLKADDEPTRLQKAGEEWGVVAIIEGMDCSIMVPIAADLSEDVARTIATFVDQDKGDFLYLDEVPSLLAAKSGTDPKADDAEVFVSIAALSWDEIRDISQDSNLPLSEAIFFRKPVTWDLLRARLSGAKCPPLPVFSDKDFLSRSDRSVKFNRYRNTSTLSLLSVAAKREVDLDTPKGRNWFALVVDGLNSLGIGKPFEGLSVMMSFEVVDKNVGIVGLRNLCIGYGLDPLQASYLQELAQSDPDAFHMLSEADGRLFHLGSIEVIPDMHLSTVNATIEGRDPATYERLVSATKNTREYLNA